MATTTNYGWTTPDDTALVKDGAAAIRSLGTSVDTTTKNLNPETTLGDIAYRSSSANVNTRLPLGTAGQVLKVNSGATAPEWATDASGMTNPMTTTGDTIYSSSGSTPARLGIGTAGQVLTVAGGVPSWATAGATGSNWSLVNAGGTALTGAGTITVSGISSADQIMVIVRGASAANTGVSISLRFNTDSAGNYNPFGASYGFDTTYSAANFSGLDGTGSTEIPLIYFAGAHTSTTSGYALIDGANSSGNKIFTTTFGTSGTSKINYAVGGFYNSASTISSISLITDNGNFDGGTVYVYTTA